ncbi:MAG: L,D-transpeptidase [Burkholderiales bacterium]|nr:MAG: L,D-transpeptidase [Burkholderiales bacterium]
MAAVAHCSACAAVDFGQEAASADARELAHWALETQDTGRRHFLIVDKKDARVYVFRPDGRLLAASPALLGSARGDHSVPGVGLRAQTGQVAPEERTTPAGRFLTQPGRNLTGEHVVWMDYASAFAIHRVRAGTSYAARLRRLASATPDDNRVSLGCVVVPEAFYEGVIEPLLGRFRAVVYVMPEMQPARDLFGAM